MAATFYPSNFSSLTESKLVKGTSMSMPNIDVYAQCHTDTMKHDLYLAYSYHMNNLIALVMCDKILSFNVRGHKTFP